MRLKIWSLVKGVAFLWLLWMPKFEGLGLNQKMVAARRIDRTMQNYAYRAFVQQPRTGTPYDGVPPPYLSGIKISAISLRSDSLYQRGVETFKEFRIPVAEHPYVERVVLVYQNFGNWSSTYYSLPGYDLLTPVLGLLAYNGSNISGVNLAPLDFWAPKEAMTIKFEEVRLAPPSLVAKCALFYLTGMVTFTDVVNENMCLTTEQGHYSIVVESVAPPPDRMNRLNEGHPGSQI